MRQIYALNIPPPQESYLRVARHKGFQLHPGAAWKSVCMARDGGGAADIEITTVRGLHRADFLIVCVGFIMDLARRPELAAFADRVAVWRDRYIPPPGEEDALLETYPYLGPSFEFLEKEFGTAPFLRHIRTFTFGTMVSMGLSGGAISGLKYAATRLAQGITRQLYLDDAEYHYRWLLSYDTPELTAEIPEEKEPIDG
jgi:hypothetical protein